ncbi:hypothetical protein [Klebsiella grimontii]|uniref:hypothetical protein n=1 Tax=Klebsiella grimontii TaxID=2058152 RepID=UPI0039FD3B4F
MGSLSGITSTLPRDGPATSQSYTFQTASENAAAGLCQYRLLNPAGSGVTKQMLVRCFNEPRAAFYTEKRGKKQNKNMRVAVDCQEKLPPPFFYKCDEYQKRLEMGSRTALK